MRKVVYIILTALGFLVACAKESTIPESRVPILPLETLRYDSVAGDVSFDPWDNFVVDNNKATLGRVLFYETQLSKNNRVSCGSCHKQAFGFADNVAKSIGFDNGLTKRNSQAILNAGLQEFFFHDLRESHLENMVLMPIADHVEMGLENKEYMVAKVEALPYYKSLFLQAFGSETVTAEKISDGLVHFIRSMISVNSKWDIGNATGFANFSPEELHGKNLYFIKFPCSSCHGGDNLMGGMSAAENVGLDKWYGDLGEHGMDPVLNVPKNGWFKVPSLRNVEVTGPYMHDGRFNTLEEVVEFYNSGIQRHPQLSFMLRRGNNGGFFDLAEFDSDIVENIETGIHPLRMGMTQEEKKALVAFMKTFTDWGFLNDNRFSDPFIRP